MPLQKSRSKSKDKKKENKDAEVKKKVVKKSSVKTTTKDGKISQVSKQSVVVNIGADGVVKKRRGRPRTKKPAQTAPKPPQFVTPPQSGLVQQVFQPPLPAQNFTQPTPPNFARANPLAPTASISMGTQTINQAVARRLSASTENPLLSQSEFVSTGIIPPPVSARVSLPAPPTSPRAERGFTSEQLDFMKRISSSFQDTPLKALKKRLKARIPVSIEEIDEDEASVLSDRDYTAYERVRGFNELDLLAREMRKNRKKSNPIPETKRIRIGDDEVLRSHPQSTLGKKPTDKDFITEPVIQEDVMMPPPPRDLMADVYNPPDTAVSVIKPKKKKLRLVPSKLQDEKVSVKEEMGDAPVPKMSEIPDVMDDVARQELPPDEQEDFTHAVAFTLPSATKPLTINRIFNVNKEAKDLQAYIRSGAIPSRSGQFDLRGRRIGSYDTYQRTRIPTITRARSPVSRSAMSSPERTAQTEVLGIFDKARKTDPELNPVRENLLAYVTQDQSKQFEDLMEEFYKKDRGMKDVSTLPPPVTLQDAPPVSVGESFMNFL